MFNIFTGFDGAGSHPQIFDKESIKLQKLISTYIKQSGSTVLDIFTEKGLLYYQLPSF